MKGYVLAIDDNPMDLKTVGYVVDQENYIPILFTSFHQAAQWLESEIPALIFLDLVMPDFNGFDLIKRIKTLSNLKNCPLTILSGKNEMLDVKKALALGADDYVVKPIDPLVLKEKLQRTLSKSAEPAIEVPLTEDKVVEAAILKTVQITSISEFGLSILSPISFKKDQVITLVQVDTEIFANSELQIKVHSSSPESTGFLIKATYVGIKETQRQNLRKNIQRLWIQYRGRVA